MKYIKSALDNFEIFRPNKYNDYGSFKINREPYLDIVLTDKCNRKCKFCVADLLDKKTDCDVEVFKNQISWAVDNMGVREVLIVGGEPTIAKGLFPVLAHLKKIEKIKKVCITTNGDRLHSGSNISSFTKLLLCAGITHINLSLMSLDETAQKNIGGTNSYFPLTALKNLYSACRNNDVQLRINCNVFRGNQDKLDDILSFYNAISEFCDSVKFSPLLRVDSFSVVNKVISFVRDNILSEDEYEDLFKKVEAHFSEFPIVRNPLTFGFVEYSMMLADPTPIVFNYNHRGRMAEFASKGYINNIKLLTNGNLSLSWNKEDTARVIRQTSTIKE